MAFKTDGSDHRGCCTQWGVPRRCLDWCRGEAVSSTELCALAYTKPIISCFHEGKGTLILDLYHWFFNLQYSMNVNNYNFM